MKSVEFWQRLPLSEKLYVARLVVEKSDAISPSTMDPKAREIREELRDLAAKMLDDCVAQLRDPGTY